MNVASPSFTRLSVHQATEKVSPSKKVTISNCDLTHAVQYKQKPKRDFLTGCLMIA